MVGVFPSDKLPKDPPRPCCLVVNTDPSDKPGTHWVAIFIDAEGVIDYFDSYGLEPSVPDIVTWIRLNGTGLNTNQLCVQSFMSSACGAHCLYFLVLRCRGFPMHSITRLTDSSFVNDSFVVAYVNKHCNVKADVFDGDVLVNQICAVFGLNR